MSRKQADQSSAALFSIVVPCFNEQEVIPETWRRLGGLRAAIRDSMAVITTSHKLQASVIFAVHTPGFPNHRNKE